MSVLTLADVDAWISAQRALGHKIGFTCGAFDILHAGHVDYLTKARSYCDRLLVAVNSDESIRQYKDPSRPINSEQRRMQVVAALRAVDAVTLMEDTRPLHLIKRWQPEVYIKGGDYEKTSLRSAAQVEAYGGRVVLCPVEHDVSTTKLIAQAACASLYSPPAEISNVPAPLILLDRDGTVITNVPHIKDPLEVALLPGVGEGLAELQDLGFRLVLVTNQQGLGLGYFSYHDFVAINTALFRLLSPYGIKIAKVYYCPHSVADSCRCRKPGSEMIERALRDFSADPKKSFVLGDTASDVAAAAAAGCRGLLVSEGQFQSAVQTIRESLKS